MYLLDERVLLLCSERAQNDAQHLGISNMSDQKLTVMAHAPGSPGQFSELAAQVRDATGASCVALVIIDAAGNGGYSIAGPLEAQFIMPHTLEQIATQLRSQLASSVQ